MSASRKTPERTDDPQQATGASPKASTPDRSAPGSRKQTAPDKGPGNASADVGMTATGGDTVEESPPTGGRKTAGKSA